ncbi:hypothetical protein GCM10010123_30290 [Pilimelia anulata]|uniref:DUF3152 domain-containing protein n=1 Tax=Pilimelia anulata TaxID=53371 RepID=A0A8J3B638_9ACTN|nr:DUF3152 domain-containing protein [Pilimelia anulata]GGJ98199.1 hypothetical protein GCM10010123_30290 [Pilimelia anulata]
MAKPAGPRRDQRPDRAADPTGDRPAGPGPEPGRAPDRDRAAREAAWAEQDPAAWERPDPAAWAEPTPVAGIPVIPGRRPRTRPSSRAVRRDAATTLDPDAATGRDPDAPPRTTRPSGGRPSGTRPADSGPGVDPDPGAAPGGRPARSAGDRTLRPATGDGRPRPTTGDGRLRPATGDGRLRPTIGARPTIDDRRTRPTGGGRTAGPTDDARAPGPARDGRVPGAPRDSRAAGPSAADGGGPAGAGDRRTSARGPVGRLTGAGRAALAEARRREARPLPPPTDDRRRRAQRRRQRVGVVAVLLAAAAIIGVDLARDEDSRTTGRPLATTEAPTTPSATATPSPTGTTAAFPNAGPGTFGYAAGTSRVYGRSGPLLRYRVGVESDTGQDRAAFAAAVERTLGDPRGWTAGGERRFQRVPAGATADFSVLLATPVTSERMCAAGGLRTERFTNCRVTGRVIINQARWWQGVPRYRAPLAEYREYVVNHEVGHELGRGHEGCPRRGAPAPVMQQQTLGLRGCIAYGWPYRDSRPYTGPPVP